MAEVKINKNNFGQEVLKSEKPVLLDFWASWCGPCRMLAPELEKLAEKYEESLVVAKANVDEESELAMAHRVESIPTLVLYDKGEIKKISLGYKSAEDIEKWLDINN